MLGIPRKRLYVYVVAGLLVLAVGSAALLSWQRQSSAVAGAASPVVVVNGGVPGLGEAESGGTPAGTTGTVPVVTTTETAPIYVQVDGAVRRPGVYRVPAGTRVFEAIDEAGGFTEDADSSAVALAVKVTDGCRIYVPRAGETTHGSVVTPEATSAGVTTFSTGLGQATGASPGILSLNTATAQELESLPGIGPALAQRIVAYREANGPFTSIDQLTEVPGIGPARLEQLRPLVGL